MLKKDSLIKGTLILAAAALTARFLGLFQRIPLDYMLGADGQAAFNQANQLYLLLLTVATGGIPVTISKMISQRYALGRPEEARQIYKAALLFGAVTGVLLAVAMFVLAPQYAELSKVPQSTLSLKAIAPALLLFPIIAMTRGYFQGRQIMSAGAISQIVEQILRILGGIGLALIILGLGWGDEWGAAAIAFGSVFGSIGAFVVMLRYARKLKRQDKAEADKETGAIRQTEAAAKPLRFRSIYREIFTMSIPAVVTAMTVQFVYFFDQTFFMRLTASFYNEESALEVLANYSTKAMALAGIPPILAIALGASIIPVIASAYSLKKMDEVQRQASLVMRIVCFTGVPVALLLTVAAYSVTGLLFTSPSGSGAVALLTAGTIMQITMMTTNSILYGLDMPRLPMMHTFVGFGLKILFSVALAPWMGVYGLIVGSSICFIVITWLNVRRINRQVKLNVLGRRWAPYMAAIAIPAAAGWGAEYVVLGWTEAWAPKLSYLTAGAAAAVVVGGLYVLLLAALRVVTPEDIRSFPGPLRKAMTLLLKPFYKKSR
ncbi:putative polysaccharide biosynthesis protein [Paenibacillus arenilitoris]|uniref:Polysaccharide biosynthesis protein n=1 Tax=Paenibacillus arenilitoris TaxID=2772299 RepID=A0A927CHB0_9BACL|nr:polysaccharide biosynthesis protein [Paenibacillus arenilitoris]MBD2868094.1 polysaccharide biosynthesis protein [Paenibacillus arenilitoris]